MYFLYTTLLYINVKQTLTDTLPAYIANRSRLSILCV
jgi:hypothetical protein